MKELNIAGFHPFSTIDWPGRITATIFLQGCPYRCPYCHNFQILDPKVKGKENWEKIEETLSKRRGLLDGVVFSGGEAILQAVPKHGQAPVDSPLGKALSTVKTMGFETALHYAGSLPNVLERLLEAELLDWVGMDIKALPEAYKRVTGSPIADKRVLESLEVLNSYDVEYETRLTLWPGLVKHPNKENLLQYGLEVAKWAYRNGSQQFALQNFQKTPEMPEETITITINKEQALTELKNIGFQQPVVR